MADWSQLRLVEHSAPVTTGAVLASVKQLLGLCHESNLCLQTAESCTGGLLASYVTSFAGVSSVYYGGVITYSNGSKVAKLGVDPGIIKVHGAVSGEVAEAMLRGALAPSEVDVGISITGIAGPGGGSVKKPVGLVFIGVGAKYSGEVVSEITKHLFVGTRRRIRVASCNEAARLATRLASRLIASGRRH